MEVNYGLWGFVLGVINIVLLIVFVLSPLV